MLSVPASASLGSASETADVTEVMLLPEARRAVHMALNRTSAVDMDGCDPTLTDCRDKYKVSKRVNLTPVVCAVLKIVGWRMTEV
jgi:hypothetical protein